MLIPCGDREDILGCAGCVARLGLVLLSARLMVSLPVHVSCFYLNIVYTNMSGVTPSPPFSRLVLELFFRGYFSGLLFQTSSSPVCPLLREKEPSVV